LVPFLVGGGSFSESMWAVPYVKIVQWRSCILDGLGGGSIVKKGPDVDVSMSVRTSVRLGVCFGNQSQKSTGKYEVEYHHDDSSCTLIDETIIKTAERGR
jgi:hypothetical protein